MSGRKRCCRPPVWVIIGLCIVVALVVAVFAAFGVTRSANEQERAMFYTMITNDVNDQLNELVEQLFYRFRLIAQSIYDLEPLLQTCQIPDSGYSSNLLARLFNAMDDPEQPLGSLGIIRRNFNSAAKYGAPGKYSWQIAAGFGCSSIIWGVCDPGSYPNFTGTCAYPLNGSLVAGPPIYQGEDWGLKPEEVYLLNASTPAGSEAVLPVFSLLNSLTLTYQVSVPQCSGNLAQPYAIVFAEQSLNKLDKVVKSLSGTFADSITVLVEQSTGLLLASSVPNQTQVGTGRYHMNNVTDARLREIFQALGGKSTVSVASENLWISSILYTKNHVNWILISALPQRSLLEFVRQASVTSIGVSVGMVVIMPIVVMLVVYYLVSKPIYDYRPNSSKHADHFTDEIQTLYTVGDKSVNLDNDN